MTQTYMTVTFIASFLELFIFAVVVIFGIFYSVQGVRDEQMEALMTKNEELERQNKELQKLVKKNENALERENGYGAKDCRNLIYGKRDQD